MGETAGAGAHRVVLEDCKNLTATGISAILSYDEASAVMATPYGTLNVGGSDLTVSELSVQTGEVHIQGTIEYVQYTAKKEKDQPFLKRFFR